MKCGRNLCSQYLFRNTVVHMPNMFVLNDTFRGKSENRMRHVTFGTLSWKHKSINFLHLSLCALLCFLPTVISQTWLTHQIEVFELLGKLHQVSTPAHNKKWPREYFTCIYLMILNSSHCRRSLFVVTCVFTLDKDGVLFLTCVSLMKSMHWNSYWNVLFLIHEVNLKYFCSYFLQAKIIL